MISSYNSTTQTISTGGLVSFDTNRIDKGCSMAHIEGSTTFKLNKPGHYFVTFNAVVSSSTAGTIVLQLRNGTKLIPGAIAMANVAANTDIRDISFATIIKVPPSCCAVDNAGTLSIQATGDAMVITAPNINIIKIC